MDADSLAVVKLLLAAGADATAVDGVGMTVLQWQARKGACAGTVCLLLKAGADPTDALQHNGIYVTAATFAGINGHFALERLLSRAADDYRKKHPATASSATDVTSSNSTGSSVSSSGANINSDDGNSSVTASGAGTADSGATASASTSTQGEICGGSATTAAHNTSTTKASAASVSTAVGADDADNTSSMQKQQQQQQQCKQRKTKQPCANCSKPTTKLCRRCAAVYYCSVECQKVCFADAQHRAQCESTSAEWKTAVSVA
eukprot:7252-Heterococcus_DN1.PRE.1